jgi:hypothetical protein
MTCASHGEAISGKGCDPFAGRKKCGVISRGLHTAFFNVSDFVVLLRLDEQRNDQIVTSA